MEVAANEAIDGGLTVEEADAVAGKPMGVPKTGIFGLMDLVGIDLGPHIAASMLDSLPEGDTYREIHRESELIGKMIEDGSTAPAVASRSRRSTSQPASTETSSSRAWEASRRRREVACGPS